MRRKKVAWDDAFHQLALRVPERNDALDQLVDGALQRSPSRLQEYVIARLDGARGPTWLDSQTLEQAFRATEMLGVLLEFGPEALPGQLSDNDWDTAGRAGYAATSKGEGGIRDALQATQSRFLKQGIKPERGNVLGATYRWLASLKNSKDPGDIRRISSAAFRRERGWATFRAKGGRMRVRSLGPCSDPELVVRCAVTMRLWCSACWTQS
ncbi:hypothetical protein [Antarctobacter sp.]|uniref:hypothetical protein n=1 Tax=Antarctobacter sp. TaxID=1872577 RepID=UPI003A8CA01B